MATFFMFYKHTEDMFGSPLHVVTMFYDCNLLGLITVLPHAVLYLYVLNSPY